jgi:hypothetical protein
MKGYAETCGWMSGGAETSTGTPLEPSGGNGPDTRGTETYRQVNTRGQRHPTSGCSTAQTVSSFYKPVEGPVCGVAQSSPMILNLENFLWSSPEVLQLEIERMDEEELREFEACLDAVP